MTAGKIEPQIMQVFCKMGQLSKGYGLALICVIEADYLIPIVSDVTDIFQIDRYEIAVRYIDVDVRLIDVDVRQI